MDEETVGKILENWREADLNPKVRATFGFLEKMTLEPQALGPEDVEPLRAVGVSDESIRDAIYICAYFNLIDRVADALDFKVPEPEAQRAAAQQLWRRGYRA